jgi:hypothetical protein
MILESAQNVKKRLGLRLRQTSQMITKYLTTFATKEG